MESKQFIKKETVNIHHLMMAIAVCTLGKYKVGLEQIGSGVKAYISDDNGITKIRCVETLISFIGNETTNEQIETLFNEGIKNYDQYSIK